MILCNRHVLLSEGNPSSIGSSCVVEILGISLGEHVNWALYFDEIFPILVDKVVQRGAFSSSNLTIGFLTHYTKWGLF